MLKVAVSLDDISVDWTWPDWGLSAWDVEMGNKRIAIMQPYFFPYIGYFHLLHAVDRFVLYDNLKYTKKGWINRNRFLEQGTDACFSIPLRKASDALMIDQREVSDQFDRGKLLRRIRGAYQKAPYFETAMGLFTSVIESRETNLFRFIRDSLEVLCGHLGIDTPIIDSSSVPIDHSAKGQEKVLALCAALGADTYVNAIGGMSLYDAAAFEAKGIELRFVQSQCRPYRQFGDPFVAWLSILDVLMFNDTEAVRSDVRGGYSLINHRDVA